MQKSDLMDCLEQHLKSTSNVRPRTNVSIMDGVVLVSNLRPTGCKTFGDYTAKVFVPHIEREQNRAQRVDIVWNQYHDNSLKAQTRQKRGTEPTQRRRVEMSSPIPMNWHQFLLVNDNKTELFKLLNSELIASTTAEKSLVVTNGDTALGVPARDMPNLVPCNHGEADSRIMVHVADAIMPGFSKDTC